MKSLVLKKCSPFFLLAAGLISGCTDQDQPTISVISADEAAQLASEDLRLYKEDILKANLAEAFRVAYGKKKPSLDDEIAWHSPVSGKTSMSIGFISYSLKDGEIDAARWSKACYQARLEEEDIALPEDVQRSAEDIRKADYAKFERRYFGYICLEKEAPDSISVNIFHTTGRTPK